MNLERFIDQIAQHLKPEPFLFLRRNSAAIGYNDQCQTVVDVGARDDVTVHDRRRLAQVRIYFTKRRQNRRQVESGVNRNILGIGNCLGEPGGGKQRYGACCGKAFQSDVHASKSP